jgi:hypothetical protein
MFSLVESISSNLHCISLNKIEEKYPGFKNWYMPHDSNQTLSQQSWVSV